MATTPFTCTDACSYFYFLKYMAYVFGILAVIPALIQVRRHMWHGPSLMVCSPDVAEGLLCG